MLRQGEEENGAGPWKRDSYGAGEMLGGKRMRRGWDGGVGVNGWVDGLVMGAGMENRERDWEGVRGLLEWRGGESGVEIYPGSLPWD